MNAYHPDDSGMLPVDKDKRKNDNKKRPSGFRGAMIGSFLPGQRGSIASQLNSAFGGGGKQWKSDLSAIYAPFRNASAFSYDHIMHNGRKNGGNPDKTGTDIPPPRDGYTYWSGR